MKRTFGLFNPKDRTMGEIANKASNEQNEALLANTNKRSSWREVKTSDHGNTIIEKLRSAFCLGVS